MTRPLLFRILIPLAMVLLAEGLLRLGIWENMAQPSSRIGATVALKRRLLAVPEPVHIVTLGNSRAEFGLDHELLAAAAQRHGKRHAPAYLRGANWLSWVTLSNWLKSNRPEVENALIAISAVDLIWANNGPYEIRMVEPFRSGLWPPPEARALFNREDSDTYAVFSSLWAYRADLSDYVRDPMTRHQVVGAPSARIGATVILAERNLCQLPTVTMEQCAAHAPKDMLEIGIVRECKDSLPAKAQRPDWRMALPPAQAAERASVRALRQQQLRDLPFRRPVVVLMPVLKMWRDAGYPSGYDTWVQETLAPLVASGRIELIDATGFFDTPENAECQAFADLYHQNRNSATQLTKALLPRIEAALYQANEASP